MATFYAIRNNSNGKLLVQQHMGVGMRYIPTARDAGDVEHLQHLVTFKTDAAAKEFISTNLCRILNAAYDNAAPEHLQIVPLEIALRHEI